MAIFITVPTPPSTMPGDVRAWADAVKSALESAVDLTPPRYTIQGNLTGKPTIAQELFHIVMPFTVTLPAGLGTSRGGCEIAPTGSVTCAITKNGVSVGTMNIAAAATVATFTMAAKTIFAAGDILNFAAPTPVDATLSGLFYSFLGTQT